MPLNRRDEAVSLGSSCKKVPDEECVDGEPPLLLLTFQNINYSLLLRPAAEAWSHTRICSPVNAPSESGPLPAIQLTARRA